MPRYYTRACNFYFGKQSKILVNKKQKKQNIKNDVKADTKVQNNNPIDEESKSYEQINPIGSVIN